MPGPIAPAGSPSDPSTLGINPEEQLARACLPRGEAAQAPPSRPSPAVEHLVRSFKSLELRPETSSGPLGGVESCIPELVVASLTCVAAGATAAPTFGASLMAASACIGAGAAAGRCLAKENAAIERRALEDAASKACKDEGGVPLGVRDATLLCLIP